MLITGAIKSANQRSKMTETWNYRRAFLNDGGERYFAIIEVYYTDGVITSWTDDPQMPYGDTEAELESDFEFMKEAFDQPILDVEELILIQKSRQA